MAESIATSGSNVAEGYRRPGRRFATTTARSSGKMHVTRSPSRMTSRGAPDSATSRSRLPPGSARWMILIDRIIDPLR